MSSSGVLAMTPTEESLRFRNVSLHLEVAEMEMRLQKLEMELASWKQVAIAAADKARQVEALWLEARGNIPDDPTHRFGVNLHS